MHKPRWPRWLQNSAGKSARVHPPRGERPSAQSPAARKFRPHSLLIGGNHSNSSGANRPRPRGSAVATPLLAFLGGRSRSRTRGDVLADPPCVRIVSDNGAEGADGFSSGEWRNRGAENCQLIGCISDLHGRGRRAVSRLLPARTIASFCNGIPGGECKSTCSG